MGSANSRKKQTGKVVDEGSATGGGDAGKSLGGIGSGNSGNSTPRKHTGRSTQDWQSTNYYNSPPVALFVDTSGPKQSQDLSPGLLRAVNIQPNGLASPISEPSPGYDRRLKSPPSFFKASAFSGADPEKQRYLISDVEDVPGFADRAGAVAAAAARKEAGAPLGSYEGALFLLPRNGIVELTSPPDKRRVTGGVIYVKHGAEFGCYVAEAGGQWLRKMGQPWSQEVSARRLMDALRGYIPSPHHAKVMLLRSQDLISAGRLPLYSEVSGKLVSHPKLRARQLSLEVKGFAEGAAALGKALFVCHRWAGPNPDTPDRHTWSAIVSYLKANEDLAYVWLDCACLSLPTLKTAGSDTASCVALSVLPAILASDEFLLVPGPEPSLTTVSPGSSIPENEEEDAYGNCALALMCGRAWMQLEVACAIVGNIDASLHSVQPDGRVTFTRIVLPSHSLARGHAYQRHAAAAAALAEAGGADGDKAPISTPGSPIIALPERISQTQTHNSRESVSNGGGDPSVSVLVDQLDTRLRGSGLGSPSGVPLALGMGAGRGRGCVVPTSPGSPTSVVWDDDSQTSFTCGICPEPAVLLERVRQDLEMLCGVVETHGRQATQSTSVLLEWQRSWMINTMRVGPAQDSNSILGKLRSWKYIGATSVPRDRELVAALLLVLTSYAEGYMQSGLEDIEREDVEEKLWANLRNNEGTLLLQGMSLNPEEGVMLVSIAFELGMSLHKIVVRDTLFAGRAVVLALQNFDSLMELSMDNTGCTHVFELAAELARSRGLVSLSMPRNMLGDEGIVHIAQAMTTNFTLKSLDCSHNFVGDVGVIALSEALTHNDSLRNVCLAGNKFGDVGAAALVAALQSSSIMLESLDLRGNSALGKAACANLTQAWGLRPPKGLLLYWEGEGVEAAAKLAAASPLSSAAGVQSANPASPH